MTTFSVWAPNATERVDLVLPRDGRRVEMAAASRQGWWAVDVEEAGAGTDYQFSLDGGPGFPDPRSEFQPEGVHGPSRVVDHGA
ncbi:MAG TPA: malto-oligosyltrehalose trehalohydrolase, partial [Acidimicrobiia bacterium]|nr:malto-oligosyltrehalose trehalohydrolase [Acidimicrobiia bacterium]